MSEAGSTAFKLVWYDQRPDGTTQDLIRVPMSGSGQTKGAPSVVVRGLEAGNYFNLSSDGTCLVYARTQVEETPTAERKSAARLMDNFD